MRIEFLESKEAIKDESVPPDKKQPSGTSAIEHKLVASFNVFSNCKRISFFV